MAAPKKASTAAAKDALATQVQAEVAVPGQNIATYLERQKPAILAALPRNVDVDRFTRIVLTNVRQSPRLLACDPMSLLAAVMQAAQLGLEPGNGLNEAHLVPYGKEVSFQIGYRGAVKLATNGDVVRSIYAEAVYEGEHFKVRMGTEPGVDHIPAFDVPGRGTFAAMTHVYAVAVLANGEKQFAAMGKAEIEQHRDRYSKAAGKKDSPWSDELGAVEMAKKTVVLRLSKLLPLTAEVSRAFAADGVVRHELAPDMVLIPDAADEAVAPEALGAAQDEAAGVVDTNLAAACTECGQITQLTDDATEADVADMKCGDCGAAMQPVQAAE